jgi:hypothetical protein
MQKTDTPAPVGATVTEVLREELCSMEQRDAENARHLEALRAAVQLGTADIAAGRFKSFDSKASLRQYLRSVGGHEDTNALVLRDAPHRPLAHWPLLDLNVVIDVLQ